MANLLHSWSLNVIVRNSCVMKVDGLRRVIGVWLPLTGWIELTCGVRPWYRYPFQTCNIVIFFIFLDNYKVSNYRDYNSLSHSLCQPSLPWEAGEIFEWLILNTTKMTFGLQWLLIYSCTMQAMAFLKLCNSLRMLPFVVFTLNFLFPWF